MTRSAPLRGTEGVVVQVGRGSMRNEPRLFEVRGGDHWGQRIGSDVLERSKHVETERGSSRNDGMYKHGDPIHPPNFTVEKRRRSGTDEL